MSDITKYLDSLINLGINEREAKVYLAMLRTPNAKASELQKVSGLRRSKIYEVISNLVRQGFATERNSKNIKTFEAIDPEVCLREPLKKLEDKARTALSVKNVLHDIYIKSEKVKKPFEYIEIIHGNINVHRKYIDLVKSVKSEILSYVRPPFAFTTEEMKKEQEDAYLRCRKKGVKVRHIFEHNEDSPDMIVERINYDANHNSDFRIHTNLPLKMFVFDRTTLLIADEELSSDEGELTVSIIKQETTVKGYVTLFDFVWNQSMKYDEWFKTQNQ